MGKRASGFRIETAFVEGFRPKSPLSARMGRRAFLTGAAGAAVGASAVVRAAAAVGKLQVSTTGADGGRPRRAVLRLGEHRWTIDTALFDGDPQLEVHSSDGAARVRLEGALLPGTAFAVSYEAEVRTTLSGPAIRIRFENSGVAGASWSAEAPFGAWLSGEAHLESALDRRALQSVVGGTAHPLSRHAVAVAGGPGAVRFEPDHGFVVDAPCRVLADGRTLPVGALALRPCPKGFESLLATPRRSFTALTGPGGGDCTVPLALAREGLWSIGGDVESLEEMRLELHGDRAGLLVAGRGACLLESSAGSGLALGLTRPRVAKVLGTSHHVLAADIDSDGAWLDLGGCGLEIGPGESGGLVAQIDPDGEAQLELDGSMRRFAASFDGAVVGVKGGEPEPIELAIEPQQRQVPPPTRQVPPPTRQVPPVRPQTPNRVQIRPGLLEGLIRLPFAIDVVRREDMLALSFEFINLSLQVGSGAPRLVRGIASKPAYLIVTFPSQSLAEKTFPEIGPPLGDVRPAPARLSGPTKLVFFVPTSVPYIVFNLKGEDGKGKNGLLDWSKLRPNVIPTAVSSYGPSSGVRVDPGFANPLERVKIPPGGLRRVPPPDEPMGLVASIGGLLARRGRDGQDRRIVPPPQQRVQKIEDQLGTLAPNFDPTLVFKLIPSKRMPIDDSPYYTAIEMPIRLYLSPTEKAGWAHRADLMTFAGRTELWHSRLGIQRPNGVLEGPTTVRAVDAVDYDQNMGELFGPQVSDQIMMASDRKELVDNMAHREIRNDSRPFPVKNLMLTPLGGYLKGHGTWDEVWVPPPTLPSGYQDSKKMAWTHIATLGRDQYVKLVDRGYLYPTGHPAARVRVFERKVHQTATGPVIAYLRFREYVIVRVPKLLYNAAEQRELGFRSLECLTLETPSLDVQAGKIAGSGPAQTEIAFWMRTPAGPVAMHMRGEDVEGRIAEWSMPMIYVAYIDPVKGNAASLYQANFNLVQAHYMGSPDGQPLRRNKAFGQKMAFAPDDTGKESTSFPVEELFFSAKWIGVNTGPDSARFRCILHRAKVKVQALQYMAGADNGPVEVAIPDTYKQSGFSPANKVNAFFEVPTAKDLTAGTDTTKTGGLINLDQKVTAFTKGKGPVGGALQQVLGGNTRPEDFMPDSLKILGAVSLWQLLPDTIAITPDNNNPEALKNPRLEVKFDKDPNGVPTKAKVEFRWYPEVHSWPADKPLLVIKDAWSSSNPTLSLVGDVGVDLKSGSSDYSFVGKFSNFRVDCIAPVMSFIFLDFDELKFEAKAGGSPAITLKPDFPKTTFTGPLTFVQKLQDLISDVIGLEEEPYLLASTSPMPRRLEGFEFKPFFDLQAGVIRVGFKLGVPTIGVGVLTIMNISLLAEVRLPLIGSALRVRFSFCERESPFRLTVMGIGGGGFMGIELGPEDVELLEASLEFGAAIALDIGVASGSISLMAGIYYKLEAKKSTLTGYVRLVGKVSVLGLVRISIEFYLELTYEFDKDRCFGVATVTVEIEICFFSFGVSMTVQKEFAGGKSGSQPLYASTAPDALLQDNPSQMTFTQAVSMAEWQTTYVGAFA